MHFNSVLLVLATLLAYSYAIVYNPEITSPSTGTVWQAGGKYTVEWKTDPIAGYPIPDTATGTLKLGYLDAADEPNEHLKWDLGTGFKLLDGSYEIELPSNLEEKTRYIIILMGNSGNASKEFTIKAKEGSSGVKKRTIEKANIKKKISLKKRLN